MGGYAELSSDVIEKQGAKLVKIAELVADNPEATALIKELISLNEALKSDTKRIITSSKKVSQEMLFWKEYEENGRDISWQSLEDIYICYKKSLFDINIEANENMGKLKIFASNLAHKVLENLVENSIRHGNATIVKLDFYYSSEQELIIVCEDNGSGIPKSDKDRIFEKGFGKHTGLGLFWSREILDITDIKIREVGGPEEGARFELIVPKDHYKQ
jgi:signal transduction histidine kinase